MTAASRSLATAPWGRAPRAACSFATPPLGTRPRIDLPDVSLAGLKPLGYVQNTSASGTLTVSDGVHTAAISLIGVYMENAFHPGADGGLGTAIAYHV